MIIKGYNGYPATSHRATHGHSIPPVTRFSRPSKENIDSQEICKYKLNLNLSLLYFYFNDLSNLFIYLFTFF